MLPWYIWIFGFSTIVSVFGLITGPARVSAAFTLIVSLLILATTWAERRRRRSSP
jgi:NADH:ubiquinone oxidoreductase subunit 6 (subunit J)